MASRPKETYGTALISLCNSLCSLGSFKEHFHSFVRDRLTAALSVTLCFN